MANTATLLTRRQTAALLGITEAEVKTRDNEAFHPIKGPDGSWRYPPEEVAAVLRGVVAGDPGADPSGATCAAAFELFQSGKKLPDVVITLKQPPTLVRHMRAEYDQMAGSLTIAPESVAAVAQALSQPIRDEANLVEILAGLGDRIRGEYHRGFDAGLAEANDLGEIVDLATGKKRPLRAEDLGERKAT
jgi:hypothetical protein